MYVDGGTTVHVVFGTSAAGSVRQALVRRGCRERVIGFPDDLSFGPINPPSSDLRRAWTESVLRYGNEWVAGAAEAFWHEATAPSLFPVAWVCTTHAAEHAGFLELVRRMAGRPFDIVDATDMEVPSRRRAGGVFRPWSLGVMTPENILDGGLAERRASVPPERIASALEMWRGLQEENAPFRVVRNGRLVSAPLTYFDAFLEESAVDEWQKAARLVGQTMGRMTIDLSPPGQCPGDVVLFGRMLALGEAGVLDVEGFGPHMRDYRVRRKRKNNA